MIYSSFGILHGSMANYIDVILIYRLFLSIPPHIIFKKQTTKKQSHFQPKPDKFLKSKIHGIS